MITAVFQFLQATKEGSGNKSKNLECIEMVYNNNGYLFKVPRNPSYSQHIICPMQAYLNKGGKMYTGFERNLPPKV